VCLADKDFNRPATIVILLGAKSSLRYLLRDKFECKGLPILQNTRFGYVLSGRIHHTYIQDYNHETHVHFTQTDSLQHMMECFWMVEELNHKVLTKEERACEKHFVENTRRLDTGCYEVRLPLAGTVDNLGDSYNITRMRFLKLEQKLLKQLQLKEECSKFQLYFVTVMDVNKLID
jgi:hypothetical protein